MPQKILFVCTGNTCRSPMAEALFREIAGAGESGFQVISAGTSAGRGVPAAEEAVQVLKEKGIDLSEHQSRPITEELLKEADLILTMTRSHKESLLQLEPGVGDKVFTLKEYARYLAGDDLVRQVVELDREEGRRREKLQNSYGQKGQRLLARREQLRRELARGEEQLEQLQAEIEKELEDVWNRRRELLAGRKQELDISDPLGGDQEVYRETREEIFRELEILRKKIVQEGETGKNDSAGQ